MSKGLSRTLVLGHIYRAGIYEYISFAICSVCFSLLPRTEAVHPLPHSHVLTLQCSQFTNTLNKLMGAHLPILSGWTCWQCSSARSCLWLLSGCRLFILCIKPSAVFKKWERRCPPESGTVCVISKDQHRYCYRNIFAFSQLLQLFFLLAVQPPLPVERSTAAAGFGGSRNPSLLFSSLPLRTSPIFDREISR